MDWFARLHRVIQIFLLVAAALVATIMWIDTKAGQALTPVLAVVAVAWAVCAVLVGAIYLAIRYVVGR